MHWTSVGHIFVCQITQLHCVYSQLLWEVRSLHNAYVTMEHDKHFPLTEHNTCFSQEQ